MEYNVLGTSTKRMFSYAQAVSPAYVANQARARKPPITLHKSQRLDEDAKKVQATIKLSNSQDPTITNLENERDRLKELARASNAQLDLYKRELKKTSATVQEKDDMIAAINEDKLALERRVEEHVDLEANMTAKLQKAKFKAALYKALDKTGDDKMICEYREASQAQWLRANIAEESVQRLEHDLANANSELQEGRNLRYEILMLQQKLNTSCENSHKVDHKIQKLEEALVRSDKDAIEIYQQAVAHIQEANRKEQILDELRTQEKARADRAEHANRPLKLTNAEQAAAIETLQNEARKWEGVAEAGVERAAAAERELGEKTQRLAEFTDRANDAEAKVKDLEQKIVNLETAVPQTEEAASETPDAYEAACVITEQNDRLERELEEATELLEELVACGVDTACRDLLSDLVYTNQCFKSVEAEFEDHYAPSVDGVNNILQDAIANLEDLHLIKNGDRPVLVRQLKEAHGVRTRIDTIIEDAQLCGEIYLDEEDREKIKEIIKKPRSLPGPEATASSSSSPSASHSNTSTAAPLYNPPRPQQAPSTTPSQVPGLQLPGLQLPGLHLPNPTASPTSGAPTPFNPLFNSTQPTNPSTPTTFTLPYRLSPAASAGSSLIPLLNLPQDSSSSDSDSDSDYELPEAFAGQYDEESDSDDAKVPPVGQRPMRQPVSRRRPRYPKAADFFT